MKSRRQQARFFWQALLIAAPLVILSAVALYSLRLDKASITQDARERARMIAPDLARQWGEIISKGFVDTITAQNFNLASPEKSPASQEIGQGLIIAGQILFPIDHPSLPTPPDWLEQLTPQQLRLWWAAEEALFQKRDPVACRNTLAAIKGAGSPEAASANAELNLLLFEAGGEPVTRERFLDVVWGYAAFPMTRTVDNHIAKLRAKIEPDPENPKWIQTVHGVGYRLEL